jgi:hypothetical protein
MTGSSLSPARRALLVSFLALMALLNGIFLRPVFSASGAPVRGYSDFHIFKIAARMLAEGRGTQLYDLSAQTQVFRQMFPDHAPDRLNLPYNHLAYEALIFRPLANVPYATSFYVWFAINVLLMLAIALLATKIINVRPSYAPLVFLAEAAFFPFACTLLQGQVSILLLFFYLLAVLAMKRDHDFAAGAVLALGLFKFHLVLPFVFALMLRRRWKVVGGFAVGAVPVLLTSFAITGIAGLRDYVRLMVLFQGNPPEAFGRLGLMANLRGLIAAGLGNIAPGTARWLVLAASALFVLVLVRVHLPHDRELANDIYTALAITFTMLVSYHMYPQDMTLLFLAFLLLVARALKNQIRQGPILAFAVVFCCTPVYLVGTLFTSLNLLALVTMALAFYLAWFAVAPEHGAALKANA